MERASQFVKTTSECHQPEAAASHGTQRTRLHGDVSSHVREMNAPRRSSSSNNNTGGGSSSSSGDCTLVSLYIDFPCERVE